jgi:site-specific DNA recombinase
VSPQNKPRKPVALYRRVSQTAGRKGESFQSPAEQEERARAAVVAAGLVPGDVYEDLDRSGATMSRPDFDRLKDDLEAGRVGGVAVSRLDRLGRTTRGVLDFVQWCEERGGVVIAAQESLDTTTPHGRFVLTIFAALAQLELERYQEQWASARAGARARGVHLSPVAPTGYDRLVVGSRADGRPIYGPLAPNGDADAIRWAFETRAGGASCREIAAEMTRRGVVLRLPNGRGEDTRWTDGTVRHVIRNEVYKTRTGDPRPGGETYDPIVPPSLWQRANAETTRTRVRAGETAEDRAARAAVLAGIVVCGSCGRPVTHESQRYRCAQRGKDAEPCPRPVSIRRSALDEFVESTVGKYVIETVGYHEEAEPEGSARADSEEAVGRARAELVELMAARGDLSPLAYAHAIDAAEQALSEAEDVLAERNDPGPTWEELTAQLEDPRARREAVWRYVERVVVHPGVGGRGPNAHPSGRVEIVYR